jgi:hypothetical protein
VTHRRRRTCAATAIGSVALAAVTLLAAQGCAPAAPAANAETPASHSLSLAAAESSYGSYLAASDAAAAAGDKTQGLSIVTAAQWAQVKAQYTALASVGAPVPRYQYGKPVFYVPALASYPQWFMVAVPRRTDTGGTLGPAVNTLLVFARAKKTLPWTLSGSAVLAQPLPAIARDSDGYAIDVATTDPSLLLRPDVVGATQAAVVDDGPASPAAAVVSDGPQTTGLYAAQSAQAAAQQAQGRQYQWLLQGAPFPQFELRLADGGALVLYGMYLDTSNEHPNLAAGSPVPVPTAAIPLLAVDTEIGFHAVWVNWTYEFAAIDPPATAHNAKLQVIASQGAPTYAHAS